MGEEFNPDVGHIEKLKIPDEDASGWVQALLEAGLAYEEVDEILTRLNEKYGSMTPEKWGRFVFEELDKFTAGHKNDKGEPGGKMDLAKLRRTIKKELDKLGQKFTPESDDPGE
jgi:hypothetical protein